MAELKDLLVARDDSCGLPRFRLILVQEAGNCFMVFSLCAGDRISWVNVREDIPEGEAPANQKVYTDKAGQRKRIPRVTLRTWSSFIDVIQSMSDAKISELIAKAAL